MTGKVRESSGEGIEGWHHTSGETDAERDSRLSVDVSRMKKSRLSRRSRTWCSRRRRNVACEAGRRANKERRMDGGGGGRGGGGGSGSGSGSGGGGGGGGGGS
eukprot:1642948-Pleurochrysis_carterae.AAC.1